jgi:hypothetical protein
MSFRVRDPMTPGVPDKPPYANEQGSYNQTIQSVHNRSKLWVGVPLLAEFQARKSKGKTPRPRPGKCIDVKPQTRHSGNARW